MSDRDDSHATRYVKVLAYLLDERLATQSERVDPASITSSDCSGRLDAKLDAEIAALTWALARLAAANNGTTDGPTWGPNDPRCICRQLEYAVAWEQEKSEVPVFTFDGETDYGTVIRHDSRCPVRPTPPISYSDAWVLGLIQSCTATDELSARIKSLINDHCNRRVDEALAPYRTVASDSPTDDGSYGRIGNLPLGVSRLRTIKQALMLILDGDVLPERRDIAREIAVEIERLWEYRGHSTPADRGNSASDTHERMTRHDDRGKIQGVGR